MATLAFTGPKGPEPAASSPPPTSVTTTVPPSTSTSTTTVPAQPVLLVWTSGGLPDGLATEVAELAGVSEVTLVRGDQTAMVGFVRR